MAITPRGMSITEAYRNYRNNEFFVNRQYQRKLVWTEEEKSDLVDSILEGFPIPLLLFAEHSLDFPVGRYEIIDGIQRLNAIFSFIENGFPLHDQYFDVNELARARQAADDGVFEPAPGDAPRLSPSQCANILDYQLAVTIFPATDQDAITEIFGRINSRGKQLSNQERRQAGVVTSFSNLVRELGAELRGDASMELVGLQNMPVISIEAPTFRLGYGIQAEETFWCKQGVLQLRQLRDSEDEQFIADLAASILLDEPFAVSKEGLDDIYTSGHTQHDEISDRLAGYPADLLAQEIKTTFSVIQETIAAVDTSANFLRRTVNPSAGGNPIKTPFFAIFMAFFELVIREEKRPVDPHAIMSALAGLSSSLPQVGRHYVVPAERVRNINTTKGLIQQHFAYVDPPLLQHGPGLAIDFENSLKRSRIETPRYEFKQGIHRLDSTRARDPDIVGRLAQIACSLANIGPDVTGFIFLGVADKEADAQRIRQLDNILPVKVAHLHVVGIDREARLSGLTIEQYVTNLVRELRATDLSDPVKTQLLANVDTIDYRGLTVIRLTVPPQTQMSWVGEQTYVRVGSETQLAQPKQINAITRMFV